MSTIDWTSTASDYARYRAGFPSSLFRRLEHFGIGGPNERCLDLGCGTGTVARGMALQGGRVTGLDRTAALIEEARRKDREAGVTIRYRVGTAEDTGLETGAFEVVTAGQCWHWFDRGAAAREVRRLLVPGGRLVLCHYDWIPIPGNMAYATEQLMLEHNPGWTMSGSTGFYPQWAEDVVVAGFEDVETFSYDVQQPYTPSGWRGRIRASSGVAAALSEEGVTAFDEALARLLADRFPGETLSVLHRVWALVCRAPQ